MTLEGYEGERVLFSYDVSGAARSVAARVCQIVFGRCRTVGDRVVKERGFIHRPGVVWIGQSVLAMPPRDARELQDRLGRYDIRVAVAPVSFAPGALEAFRGPRRRMA